MKEPTNSILVKHLLQLKGLKASHGGRQRNGPAEERTDRDPESQSSLPWLSEHGSVLEVVLGIESPISSINKKEESPYGIVFPLSTMATLLLVNFILKNLRHK